MSKFNVGDKLARITCQLFSPDEVRYIRNSGDRKISVSTVADVSDLEIISVGNKLLKVTSDNSQYRQVKIDAFGEIVHHPLMTNARVIYTFADQESIDIAVKKMTIALEQSRQRLIDILEEKLKILKGYENE